MTVVVAGFALFVALTGAVWWAVDAWRKRPSPLGRRRAELLKRSAKAREERRYVLRVVSSGRVTNPILLRAMRTNLERLDLTIAECVHGLEQLEVDETEGKVKEIEGN